ncbi:MAG: MerR family transcriptional regulator [Candidatus Latescibacteria bacterium]|nr:MerR family transcriptional regulator [Candidatus Latescibacterota bacterium]
MADEKKKLYYSISEVSELTGLKSHILRFWEGEFSILRPRKNRAGNRAYTERDIIIIQRIKKLLYDEKYTIEGAKQRLKSDHERSDSQLTLPFNDDKRRLDEIRKDLIKLRDMIEDL